MDRIPTGYLFDSNVHKGLNSIDLVRTTGILDDRELEIISFSATELLKRIHTRTFTAVEVTRAFCKSASIAHQATNCLAWVMFDQALKDAAEMDEWMATHNEPKGPLHGLPISVKEHIPIANTPSTSGFIAWADITSNVDALVIKVLRAAGAVFHVKTTVAQGLLALETDSNLYGKTTNPFNADLTTGGTSGGEAALIAMRGSLMGIGTDIVGSIRVPSGFCGIYGLKPSIARLPHGGPCGPHSGIESIMGSVGPLATCVEDMKLFCSAVLDFEPWLFEPTLIELPWKNSMEISKPLKLGVMWHDGKVYPHPPIARCLKNTVKALQKAGHFVVSWEPKLHPIADECAKKLRFLDGVQEYYDILRDGMEAPTQVAKGSLDRLEKPISIAESWKLNNSRHLIRTKYLEQWNEAGIDAILCPVSASVASVHGETTYWGYTSVFNLLDLTAVVFPVGRVEQSDTWGNFHPQFGGFLSPEDKVYRTRYNNEGPVRYRDAPISLQLVTRRFHEEEALLIAEQILTALKQSEGH